MSTLIDTYEVETILLGLVYSGRNRAVVVFEEVKPEEFNYDMIRELFLKALNEWKSSGSIYFDAVEALLPDDERKVVAWCKGLCAPSVESEPFVKKLKDLNSINKARTIADELEKAETLEAVNEHVSDLQQVVRGSIKTKPLTFQEAVSEFAYDMTQPIKYIETGFSKLDRKVLIDKGDFVILAGEQSAGKTAFSISLALSFANQGYKVVYYSLETSAKGIFYRAQSIFTGANFGNILRRDLSEDDMTRIGELQDTLAALPITVVEAAGWTVDKIRAETIRQGADIIFIDYMGLISGPGRSTYEIATGVSVGLHTLAQSLGVTVVGLAQKNREGNKANDDSMHSINGSGQFESDADLVMMVKRKEDRNGKTRWRTDVIVNKNKKGTVGAVPMWFDGETQRFTELSDLEAQGERNRVVSYTRESIKM